MWDPVSDSKMFAWNYDSPRRGAAIPERQFGEFDAALGGWTLDGEPYTSAPGSNFDWFRSRMLGGRTNHWGRISLRFGPDDFQPQEPRRPRRRLADHLRRHQAVLRRGRQARRHLRHRTSAALPERAGRHLPAAAEAALLRAPDQAGVARSSNIPCVPSRLSILTQPHNGRRACHYCGQCGRGCATHSNFSSPSVLMPPAMATGTAADHHQRDGARGHRRRRRARRPASPTSTRRSGRENHVRARIVVAGRERVRVGADPAQLEVVEIPAGPRQLQRRRRQVPDRLDRHRRHRLHPEADGQAAAQRGRRRRHAPLHAVVARQQEARFPARLPHRDRRRPAHAGRRLHRRHPPLHRHRARRARRSRSAATARS